MNEQITKQTTNITITIITIILKVVTLFSELILSRMTSYFLKYSSTFQYTEKYFQL